MQRHQRTPAEGETEREDVQDDKVPCKYCGKWVKSKELIAHIGKHHAGEKSVYACPYCAEPFAQYIGYVNHITSHKDKVIKCKTCGEQFDHLLFFAWVDYGNPSNKLWSFLTTFLLQILCCNLK